MQVLRVIVRVVGLAALVAAFSLWVIPRLGKPEDVNIGAGLLVFATIIALSLVWAGWDGTRLGLVRALLCWAGAALTFSLGWAVYRAVAEADASMSAWDLFVFDAPLIPFIVGLVLGPACVGAFIGSSLRGSPSGEVLRRPDGPDPI